jgi:hypothetical protein
MRRCGVHQAGTGFGGDVRAADDGHIARLEGVAKQDLIERRALAGTDHRAGKLIALEAGSRPVRATRISAPLGVSIRS